MPDEFNRDGVAHRFPANPNVWTDGSLVLDKVSGASSAGSGMYTHVSGSAWRYRRWEHLDEIGSARGVVDSYRRFCSVPGPLQTVQRTEMWWVILALQALDAVHLGVDDLNVVRQVGRLLDGVEWSRPAELMNDSDLFTLVRQMIERRGTDTVRVTEVKGHADEDTVRVGGVRELDRLGNNAADEAADFGRRRVDPGVIDAQRNLFGLNGWLLQVLCTGRLLVLIWE